MNKVTYEGDGLTVVFELGTPTIRTGVLESLAIVHLREEAGTNVALGQVITFGEMLKYTRKADGLPFALPTWNVTADDMRAAFNAWLDLPEALGDAWQGGIEAIKNPPPLATTTSGLVITMPPPESPPADAREKESLAL